MTLESPTPGPRKLPAPSRRNLQIYLDYQVHGLCQTQLAEKYNLTQCRISQILRRIESWRLRDPSPTLPLTSSPPPSATADQSPTCNLEPETWNSPSALDLQLQHHRLNLVAREAIRHFQQPQATVTKKQGTCGDKAIDETTTRNLPKNLQCLKIILQANNQQQRLSPAPSPSPSQSASPPSDLNPEPRTLNPPPLSREDVATWLADQHRQAEKDKKVFFSGNSIPLVKDLLKLLLGEPHSCLALRLLAAFDGKKVVPVHPHDIKRPPLPPYSGWYYAMYDYHGAVVAYLHADQVAHLLPPDYPPLVARSGGLPCSECPPLKILPRETIESSLANETANRHAPEIPPLPLGERRGEGAATASTSSTSTPATESTQPQSPSTLTSLLPPIQFLLPPLPA